MSSSYTNSISSSSATTKTPVRTTTFGENTTLTYSPPTNSPGSATTTTTTTVTTVTQKIARQFGLADIPELVERIDERKLIKDVFDVEEAMVGLCNLAATQEGALKIAQAHGIATLVDVLMDSGSSVTPKVKEGAANTLQNICNHTETKIVVASDATIQSLVKFLDTPAGAQGNLRKTAAQLLRSVSFGSDENKNKIASLGGVHALVRTVDSDGVDGQTPRTTEAAVNALRSLAFTNNYKAVGLAPAGAISSLLRLVVSARATEEAKQAAVGVLQNLSVFEEHHPQMVHSNGVAAMISILKSKTSTVKALECALSVLQNLAANPGNRQLIINAGGIDVILTVMRAHPPKQPGTASGLTTADGKPATWTTIGTIADFGTGTLHYLTMDELGQKQLNSLGLIPHFLDYLKLLMSYPRQLEYATATVRSVCSLEAARPAVIRAGGIGTLVQIISTPHSAETASLIDFAITALHFLCFNDSAAKITAGSCGAVKALIEVLRLSSDPRLAISDATQEHALATLQCLSSLDENEKHIIECKGLEELLSIAGNPQRSNRCKEYACGCLQNLTVSMGSQHILLQSRNPKLVQALVVLLSNDLAYAKTKEYAMGTLVNVSITDEVKKQLVIEGVIPIALSMLTSVTSTPLCKEFCASVLHNLASLEFGRNTIIQNNGIATLVLCLSSRHVEQEAQETAATCLFRVAGQEDELLARAAASGAGSAISRMLQSGRIKDPDVEQCLKYLLNRMENIRPSTLSAAFGATTTSISASMEGTSGRLPLTATRSQA